MQGYVAILRTGRIYDIEMACEALRKAGIPFIRQEEGISGIQDGFVLPAMGPGNYFILLVPEQLEQAAVRIISELPIEITLDPDFWHYGANERSRRWWKIFAYAALGMAAIAMIIYIIEYFISRS